MFCLHYNKVSEKRMGEMEVEGCQNYGIDYNIIANYVVYVSCLFDRRELKLRKVIVPTKIIYDAAFSL